MANYLELQSLEELETASSLRNKIKTAIVIKARAVAISASPSLAARTWAISALQNPQQYESLVLRFAAAANSGLTLAQILGAQDADVQSAVNTVVDTLLGV